MKATVAIVDDHVLMANALSEMIGRFENYVVLYDVHSGRQMIERFEAGSIPDIVLLDINMPDMDGYEVALWLKSNQPQVKVLALSMNDKEEAIVKMLRNGAKGYLLKGSRQSELKHALDSLRTQGYYYTEFITARLIESLNSDKSKTPAERLGLNERELAFIKLASSDLTYAEIADKMCLSPRTVDGYREVIFQKMNVKSRVGMVVEAIRLELVQI